MNEDGLRAGFGWWLLMLPLMYLTGISAPGKAGETETALLGIVFLGMVLQLALVLVCTVGSWCFAVFRRSKRANLLCHGAIGVVGSLWVGIWFGTMRALSG